MDTPVVPERSRVQRMTSLQLANNVRIEKSRIKRGLRTGEVKFLDLVDNPPELLRNAKVRELILACHKYGKVKTDKLLGTCRISPVKKLGGLSDRQRLELRENFKHRPLEAPRAYSARPTQYMGALGTANNLRFARADVKHAVASGERSAADVILANPPETATMTVWDLLKSQHRWGHHRTRLFLQSIPLSPTKLIGDLTDRQRNEIVRLLSDLQLSVAA